jgi:signal transduction histidine kinase/ligand-binding sensor domain-containing protein/ActR/RegA family two-component response regulator
MPAPFTARILQARAAAAIVCLLAAVPPAAGQPAVRVPLKDYVGRAWNTGEGLPQSTVRTIAQTADGYLWAGTSEGLVRFDGARMAVFDRRSSPALPSPNITALLDTGGALWIGLKRDGVIRMHGAALDRWSGDAGGLPDDDVRALARTKDGSIWACTGKGLARLTPAASRFASVPLGDAGACRSLAAGADSSLWVGTSSGLSQVDGTEARTYPLTADGPPRGVTAVLPLPDGRVLAGTGEELVRLAGGRWDPLPDPALASLPVTALMTDDSGAVWIGSRDGGIVRWADGVVETRALAAARSDRAVASLFRDEEGAIWAGFETGGLLQLRVTAFSGVGAADGLPTDLVRSVLPARDGTLWMGTAGHGVMAHRAGVSWSVTTREGLPHDRTFSLAEAPDGRVWVGTHGGLAVLAGSRAVPVRAALPPGPVRALAFGRDGRLRAGTTDGVFLVEGDGRALRIEGTRGVIRALHEAADGTWWVATLSGLLQVAASGVRVWTEADGLPSSHLSDLHENTDGTLWVATLGQGLFHFDGRRAVLYNSSMGLFDDTVFQLAADARGWLWMTSNRGLFRSPLAALGALASGQRAEVPSHAYGDADGLPTSEFNGGSNPAASLAPDGTLWFASIRGAVRVDPARVPDVPPAPGVLIESLLIDGVARAIDRPLEVPPGMQGLEIHYTARTLAASEAVRFRYRLSGFEQEWVDAGSRRAAYYTNLPPGTYRFEMAASRDGRTWGPTAAGAAMTLMPPFYSTPLFFGLSGLALAGLVALGVRVRDLRRAARERELEALVARRTRELEEEIAERRRAAEALEAARAEALQASQLKSEFLANVSHEIRTPMNGVIGMTDLALEMPLPADARRYLEVARSSADVLLQVINDVLDFSKIEAGRLDLHPVDLDLGDELSEIVTLLTPRASARGLAITARVDDDVPARVTGDPVRLRQVLLNLVNNAIKFTEVGGVRLDVALVPPPPDGDDCQWLRFRVSDTGVGIAREDQARIFDAFTQVDGSSTRRHGGTGLGLAIAARLVALMGGRMEVESTPGRGSTFAFTVPFARAAGLEEAPAGRLEVRAPACRPLRVLVAEDNQVNRIVVQHMLARSGHRVTFVGTGHEAIAAARTGGFDVILMDVQMPEMNGLEATTAIRADALISHLPIIGITAHALRGDRERCLDAGMDDYLPKPIRRRDLDAALARVVGSRRDGPVEQEADAGAAPASRIL